MLKKIRQKIKDGFIQELFKDIAWMYQYAKSYRGIIVIYVILGIIIVAAALLSSYVTKLLYNVITSHDTENLIKVIVLFVVSGFAGIILDAVNKRIKAKMSLKVTNEIRHDVFSRFLNMEWESSLDYHSGDLLSRVNSDVSTVADSVLGIIPDFFINSCMLVGSFVVILCNDPVMALLALISAPLVVIISRLFLRKMHEYDKKIRSANADLVAFYEESLQNLQTVKAFDLGDSFCDKLGFLQKLYMNVSLDGNKVRIICSSYMGIISFVISGLCFLWAGYRLWNGRIDIGTMFMFLQLAAHVRGAFSGMVNVVPTTVTATVSAGRIMTILDLPAEEKCDDELAEKAYEDGVKNGVSVELDNIEFSYANGCKVFTDFSLKADSGEIIGIVSPSGGGKTTLVRLLLGLIHPKNGAVVLKCKKTGLDVPVSPQTRKLFSYVAQEKCIFSGTVADTLRICNENATDNELMDALRLAEADGFVLKLQDGLYTKLAERGAGLSEGQLQRLAIARALLSRAPIMLLDEATSALDVATERKVLRNLLKGETKRTVIVTTHRPTVLSMCNRVYRIDNMKSKLLSDEEVQRISRDF